MDELDRRMEEEDYIDSCERQGINPSWDEHYDQYGCYDDEDEYDGEEDD